MKKIFKFIGISIAALILLIVIAIFTLTMLINPNAYKDKISQIVHQKTGAELTIAGDINWSFFPRVGFKVHDITLTKLPDFKANDFVKAGIIDMQIQLFPLLQKQLKIYSATIKQGQMRYGQSIHLQNLMLTSNNIDLNKPFKINTSFDFKQANYAGHLSIKTKIYINTATKQYNLQNLHLTGMLNKTNITLNTNVNADLNKQTLTADPIKLQLGKIKANGTLTATNIVNNPVVKGKMYTKQLNIGNLYATNVNLGINANKGIINLNPIRANFYKGTLTGQTKININSATPQISTNTNLNKVQLQPLLSDLINSRKLAGTANCNLNLTTRGTASATMIKNLNGNARININKGTIYGIDIDYILQTGQSLIIKKAPPPKPKNPSSKFNSFSGTFYIKNGQVRNNDLLFAAPRSQVKGAGTINLPKQTLNYKVRAARVTTATRNGKKVQQIDPIFIPIIITGPFNDLTYTPDFSHILQAVAQELGQTVIKTLQTGGNVGEAITKGLGETLKKGLGVDKLFK